MEYRTLFNEREKELKMLRKKVLNRLKNVPKGKLRIKKIRGTVRYYIRLEGSDSNGKYLSREQAKLIQKLAQKGYDERALTAIDAELRVIESCGRHWSELPAVEVEKVYESIAAELQEMVTPLTETDQHFAKRWQEAEFEPLKYREEDKIHATERGELVRSKSEEIIANLLFQKGVPYKYECPLKVCGRTVYPDFTGLDVKKRREVYWDHLGVADDRNYAIRAMWKLQAYSFAGLITQNRVIITAETQSDPLDYIGIRQIINELAA